MFQTTELQRILSARHVEFVGEVSMRCPAALECGYSTAESASAFGIASATVRRHLAEVMQRVFDEIEVDGDTPKLRTWVRLHFSCCTAETAEMIKNDQIFA